MKLSAYIICTESGFAPNPFGRYCTLACCKPTIRRKAEPGDIVIATASETLQCPGNLVYAMRVKEVLPYQDYWKDRRFETRKPRKSTAILRRGDNIWHLGRNGEWKVVPGSHHGERHRERDTSGVNALIATEFFYFGRDAIRLPERFEKMKARTQGHKNTYDIKEITAFWKWISGKAQKKGRNGDPHEFEEDFFRTECKRIEDEDFEEC